MTTNWYMMLQNHEFHAQRMQREAQQHRLAKVAQADHQFNHRLNTVMNRLRGSLPTGKPNQERQSALPKRTRGATA